MAKKLVYVDSFVRNRTGKREKVKPHFRTVEVNEPQEIGSTWVGERYAHGPRKIQPNKCDRFRLGKSNKKGERLVFCKLKKGKNKWKVQSKLTPIRLYKKRLKERSKKNAKK